MAALAPIRVRPGTLTVATGLAAIALLVTATVSLVRTQDRLEQVEALNQQVITVLTAPDAQTLHQPATSGGAGVVVISRSQGRMVFAPSALPHLRKGLSYEVWLMGPSGSRAAGVIDHTAAPVLVMPLKGDDRVALTVEPAGGSHAPTTEPILVAELPAA